LIGGTTPAAISGTTITASGEITANSASTITVTEGNHVNGLKLINSQAGGYGSALTFQSERSDNNAVVSAAQIRTQGQDSWNSEASADSNLFFATSANGSLTDKVTIKHDGNVGIGSSSINAKLDVNGTTRARGLETVGSPSLGFGASKWMVQQEGTATARMYMCGPDASTYSTLSIYTTTSTGAASEALRVSPDASLYVPYGIHLGGTGAANKLSDVETGTWTPSLVAYAGTNPTVSGSSSGFYTKIGQLVTVSFNLDSISVSGTTSGIMKISGLPFTPNGDAGGSYTGNQITLQRPDTSCVMVIADGFGILSQNNGGNWAWELVSIFDGGSALRATVSYKTNS
jgi:hypothetical protein